MKFLSNIIMPLLTGALRTPPSGFATLGFKSDGMLYKRLSNGTESSMEPTSAIPTGLAVPFAGGSSSVPSGFLFCNGQAVNRTTYAALFAVIGTTYGAGDGSSTFNVPDIRGRIVVGAGTDRALGDNEGQAENVRSIRHRHGITQSGSHTHSLSTASNTSVGGTSVRAINSSTGSDGLHDHGGTTNQSIHTGSDAVAHQALNYIIKV